TLDPPQTAAKPAPAAVPEAAAQGKVETKEPAKAAAAETRSGELPKVSEETRSSTQLQAARAAHQAYMLHDDSIDSDAQDNFVESKEPSELLMCLVLASAYLGLAKYCWTPLFLANDKRLFYSVEGFFLSIALLAILIGLRPFLTPSSLQLSHYGIKYRGPYWPQRKSVNWSQIRKVYLSPELIIVLYHPQPGKKRLWPLIIPSIYLADRDRISQVFTRYSPIKAINLSSPAPISRIVMVLLFLGAVIWLLEMLITQ
ncbi:MAG TPA: hypothetical protein PKH78_12960, partial [Candidatus Obscuribacter sp.]|nr:hypothetical protein [Candidatus Obscuribacter sp.]